MDIKIEKNADETRLSQLDVKSWPIWEKEISVFSWHYDTQEICYILEGEVIVKLDDGSSVSFQSGDLVTFPEGLSCTWDIKKAVRKHYRFG